MSEPESNATVEPNVVESSQRPLADCENLTFGAPQEVNPFEGTVVIGTNT